MGPDTVILQPRRKIPLSYLVDLLCFQEFALSWGNHEVNVTYSDNSRAYLVFLLFEHFANVIWAKKVAAVPLAPTCSPQKRQGLNVFPTLNCNLLLVYHISLWLCQVQPHSPPASIASLTHQCNWTMPTIELSMGVFNWQLGSINGVASSHGYSTIS